jgi:type IV pilus assembly protein PilV
MLVGAIAMIDEQQGFTLVEFLVAIVILMVGMLGMLASINIAMEKNLETAFRTEAIMVADDQMMHLRVRPFDSVSTTVASPPKTLVTRDLRGIMKNYSVQKIVVQRTSQSKEITLNVTWHKKKEPYSHSISSVITTY